MNMVAKGKWQCRKCGVIIPYNPEYEMSNVLCSHCAAYENADKLLKGYRMPPKRKL
jgi:hypothetical protein